MNIIAILKSKVLELGNKQSIIKYVRNTFWLMFEKVFPLAVAFVVGVFVARYLGPESLGVLDYGRSIALFFITFATLNLEPLLIKKLVEDEDQENVFLGTYLVLRIIAAVFVISAVITFQLFGIFEEKLVFYIVLLVTCSSLGASFDVLRSFFQSQVISQKIALATSSQIVIASSLRIFFIMQGYSLVYFAAVYFIESIVLSACLVYAYQRDKTKSVLNWKFKPGIAIETIKEWWPMVITGLIIIVYMRVDQIMIKWLLNSESVGHYSAAVRISEMWIFIGTVLTNSFFPALIKAKIENPSFYKKGLDSLLSLVVITALLIIIPISFYSTTIMTFLYGDEFAPAGGVLAIHAWSLIFIFLGLVGNSWLINEDLQRFSLYHTILGMIINIILNLIIIPIYGIMGAAFTTLVSQMLASYLGNSIYKRSRPLFYAQTRSLFLLNLISLILTTDKDE